MKTHRIALIFAAAGVMTAQTPMLRFTAATDSDSIRIDILRWSTDAERDQFLLAWTRPVIPAAGGRGGRGRAAAAPDPAPDPAAVDNDAGRAGRGGRGSRGGRGGDAVVFEAPPPTPESSLKTALGNAPTVGHLWSSEVAGYSVRSAVRLVEANGAERILLITDRRLGAWNDLWKAPAPGAPAASYEFSVIELRLNSKGEGEGKISLTGKVAADGAAKAIVLENYAAERVVLKNVRRRTT